MLPGGGKTLAIQLEVSQISGARGICRTHTSDGVTLQPAAAILSCDNHFIHSVATYPLVNALNFSFLPATGHKIQTTNVVLEELSYCRFMSEFLSNQCGLPGHRLNNLSLFVWT